MLQQQVILKSEELFMRYGIRSVSMDDIARELGISKKTLYQQVDNKSDLISKIFTIRSQEDFEEIRHLRSSADNAIQELVSVARYMIGQLRLMSSTFRYDLEKYYQDIHAEIDRFHTDFFMAFIQENLERGKQEQLYRDNIDVVVIAKLFVSMAVNMGHNEYFPVHDFKLDHLIRQLFYYHIYGVASEKGVEVMRSLLHQAHFEQL